MAGDEKGEGECKVFCRDYANGHVFDGELIEAVEGNVEYGVNFAGVFGVVGVDGHGGVPALDHKPKYFTGTDGYFFVERLIVHKQFFVFVDDHQC